MTWSQSEIMRILDGLYERGKARNMPEDFLYEDMICGLHSFAEVRPVERAKQAVDEWRRLRKKP